MKAFIRLLSFIVVLTVVSCGGSSKPTPPVAFLYVVGQGSNSVFTFNEASTGALSASAVSSIATSPIPVAIAATPSRNFVYVANSTNSSVSGYSVNHTTGILTPVGTAIAPTPVGTNPIGVGVSSDGQFLFVLNQASSNISVFSIDSTRGLLTQVGSPFPVSATPQFMVISPNSRTLYVASGPPTASTISTFSFDANGALTANAPLVVTGASAPNLAGLAIDTPGKFLYAADSANNAVAAFSIGGSGALTQLATETPAGTQPVSVALDNAGSHLYVANEGSNNVSAFSVSSGVLTQISGSPYATAGKGVLTASQPVFVTVGVTNDVVYVANQGTHSIAAFAIGTANGGLTIVTDPPGGSGIAPTWLLSAK